MDIQPGTEVCAIAMEYPAASRVFEHFGINYCCDGHKSLEEMCDDLGLSTEEVLDRLSAQRNSSASDNDSKKFPFDPYTVPLTRIIQHIVRRYHQTAREDIPRIQILAEKVRIRHGASYPEVIQIDNEFCAISIDLKRYMHDEEQSLFPSIIGQHNGHRFVASIHRMEAEHHAYGEKLQFLRRLTAIYNPPPDACLTHKALYARLQQFESDTREHMHLENNFLFRRALQEQSSITNADG